MLPVFFIFLQQHQFMINPFDTDQFFFLLIYTNSRIYVSRTFTFNILSVSERQAISLCLNGRSLTQDWTLCQNIFSVLLSFKDQLQPDQYQLHRSGCKIIIQLQQHHAFSCISQQSIKRETCVKALRSSPSVWIVCCVATLFFVQSERRNQENYFPE